MGTGFQLDPWSTRSKEDEPLSDQWYLELRKHDATELHIDD